jgi:hypothetical protein
MQHDSKGRFVKGGVVTEEDRKKLSLAGKGRKKSEAHKNKISEALKGKTNGMWTDNPSNQALHGWVRRNKNHQTNCAMCGEVKPLELANVTGKYLRDVRDYIWVCRKCHMWWDGRLSKFYLDSPNHKLGIAYNGYKQCHKCGDILPIIMFYKDKSHSDGLCSLCKDCYEECRRSN